MFFVQIILALQQFDFILFILCFSLDVEPSWVQCCFPGFFNFIFLSNFRPIFSVQCVYLGNSFYNFGLFFNSFSHYIIYFYQIATFYQKVIHKTILTDSSFYINVLVCKRCFCVGFLCHPSKFNPVFLISANRTNICRYMQNKFYNEANF